MSYKEEHEKVQALFEQKVFDAEVEYDIEAKDVFKAVRKLIWHRVKCIECTYNNYLCKDGQEAGLIEDIERAYLGDNVDHILNEADNEVHGYTD